MVGRRFNVTGVCNPTMHYMVDISAKIDTIIRDYIEPGEYFVINRARQYGKTTTLQLLERRLSDSFLVIRLSFEGNEGYFDSRDSLLDGVSYQIKGVLLRKRPDLADCVVQKHELQDAMEELSARITDLCSLAGCQIILMIDEVDRATDYVVFASFLGKLRQKYLDRGILGMDSTFHSVILAGVHDIKNLKAKIRPDSEHAYNSPWNIAASFDVDMSFSAPEIMTMLDEYEADRHTGMDGKAVAERLYYYTSGYPFLVSALCKIIHDKSLAWSAAGIDEAVSMIVQETNTLFDDVIKNIANDETFSKVIEAILVNGHDVPYIISNREVSLGLMYGIFRRNGNKVAVSNRIFEYYIYEYLIMRVSVNNLVKMQTRDQSAYVHNGKLDMDLVIQRFAEFMHREYRRSTESLVEVEGRLLFLAYLRPIINGTGHYYVEVQTRGNTRMDIVVTYGTEVFIIELKIWYGDKHEEEGVDQLISYVKSQQETKGYLVSFCDLQKVPRRGGLIIRDGAEIHEAIVAYKYRG